MAKAAIEQENFAGTKWIGSESIGDRMMIEFVDEVNCVFTTMPNKREMTYYVDGNVIFIKNIEERFELQGQVLYNRGLPAFKKTG